MTSLVDENNYHHFILLWESHREFHRVMNCRCRKFYLFKFDSLTTLVKVCYWHRLKFFSPNSIFLSRCNVISVSEHNFCFRISLDFCGIIDEFIWWMELIFLLLFKIIDANFKKCFITVFILLLSTFIVLKRGLCKLSLMLDCICPRCVI